jgi:dihydrodipicolinate reductase
MEDEVIELRHTAYSKRIFALGALEAGKNLQRRGLRV